jgi:Protein of unknown function (DUF4241)
VAAAEHLDVTYCEGWDAQQQVLVGPLTVRVARDRDAAGEQYAVLIGPAERPRLLLEVAWRHLYCAVWVFDSLLRRTRKADFRRLEAERLFLNETREWRYATSQQREFDEAAPTGTYRFSTQGQAEKRLRPAGEGGGLRVSWEQMPVEQLWRPAPQFGDWELLAAAVAPELPWPMVLTERPDPDGDAGGRGWRAGDQRPWRPPLPLRPSRLELLFRAGTRYELEPGGPVVVEVRQAGRLRMPSGRLIAADPAWLDAELEPFTTTVSPGAYPVALAVIRFEQDPRHQRVAAANLVVRQEPVVSWELALRPGEDPRMLGEGEFFGFGVDTGTAAFLDAAALTAMVGLVTDGWETFVERHGGNLYRQQQAEVAEMIDPASGANLIAFESGWGDGAYPTWIGRTAAGEVACFVADMLVVHDATVLP